MVMLLVVIWQPFFKQDKTQKSADMVATAQKNIRAETNITLYHEHKAEIEKDYSDGGIDEENYQYLLAELDSSLLQDIAIAEKPTVISTTNKPFSAAWPLMLTVIIVTFSISLYLKQGALEALIIMPTAANSNQQEAMSAEQQEQSRQVQMQEYISKAQQHLEDNPEDSQAWYSLGQTLVGAGEFDLAIASFKQVIRIEGEHADLLGAIAQASYYANNQKIDANVQMLIDKALALDINDPSTNILLGMHNFIGQQYQKAIEYWQRVINDNKQGVNVAALQEAVAEAKNRLGMPINTSGVAQQESTGPQLSVKVSLSSDIATQLAQGEDKIVFVYAIPTDGSRMPLAALKLMASDLPKTVTLSNSNAMSPQNNLSSVSKVNIYAIVSQQGGAGIKSGDFKAEVQHISVGHTETINLVVDSLVADSPTNK